MKIIDCFIYNNEDLILDLRLNTLDQYVDKFVIVESKFNHSGSEKNKFNFDENKFKKFSNKIEYLKIDKFPSNLSNWGRENFQRNYISNAFSKFDTNDYVIISDVDEIPNLIHIEKIFASKKKYTAFTQKMFYYKLNLLNITEKSWYGSKMCKLRDLKSPQWIRDSKVKKYPFYRIDKINWNIVSDGGWHFSNIMTPEEISEKIKSYAHSEYNTPEFTNVSYIKQKIENKKDIFDRDFKFIKLENYNDLPEYIKQNREKLSQFLL